MSDSQAHIFFEGTVQGVGFRYTTQRIASDLSLKGWVKNLRDGRVEVLVQGNEAGIAQLIKELDKSFDGYIRTKEVASQEISIPFPDFRIVH